MGCMSWRKITDRVVVWEGFMYKRTCHCEIRSNLFTKTTLLMTNSENEIIPVVDLDDNIIGHKARKDITHEDIYRVSACWIKDKDWNILLAQRAFTKTHSPWKRWPAVAGTVQQGETYLQNIIKEIEEEVNIRVVSDDLTIWPKKNPRALGSGRRYFGQWFVLTYIWDKSLLKAEEWAVEQLKRYTPNELEDLVINHYDQCVESLEWCFRNL